MIAPDLALRVARRRAAAHGYELVEPDDARRLAVVYGLAAAHKLTGSGWDLDHARENVCVTLPGLGPAADLLAKVPVVGGVLGAVASSLRRPTVFLSPSAVRDGAALLGVVWHEEGHVGDIRTGSLPWCVAYGVVAEVRATEGRCYGCDMAARVRYGGAAVDDAVADALRALEAYGLGDDFPLARGMVLSSAAALRRGGDPGGVLAEMAAELRREAP